jgi:hypothetical protein
MLPFLVKARIQEQQISVQDVTTKKHAEFAAYVRKIECRRGDCKSAHVLQDWSLDFFLDKGLLHAVIQHGMHASFKTGP